MHACVVDIHTEGGCQGVTSTLIILVPLSQGLSGLAAVLATPPAVSDLLIC